MGVFEQIPKAGIRPESTHALALAMAELADYTTEYFQCSAGLPAIMTPGV